MADPKPLAYVGPAPVTDGDLTLKSYADTIRDQSALPMTAAQVNDRVLGRIGPYLTRSQVEQTLHEGNYVVRTVLADFVPRSMRGQPNGPAPLDEQGQLPPQHFPARFAADQRRPRGFYTPSSYSAYAGLSQATLATFSIPDPGYAYRILCFGSFEARGQLVLNPRRPEVSVCLSDGTVIAFGNGRADTNFHQVVVMPMVADTIYTGAQTLSVIGSYSVAVGTSGVAFSQAHSGGNPYSGVVALIVPA